MHKEDTIAAIATGIGAAGISIVRLSGPDVFTIADTIIRTRGTAVSERPPGTFVYGHVVDKEHIIDEVLVLIMRMPHSYTSEDMIEIQGHGGAVCARRILRCALQAGARPAEPGEFTRRAFLNGRLDLTQAEAVQDLIHAQSERAADAALEQLEGKLRESIRSIYHTVFNIAGNIEALLDFPEEDIPMEILREAPKNLCNIKHIIYHILKQWDEGHVLRDGMTAVIVGNPNTGKSTLLNQLLERDRAIVSHHPGTTRDTIEEIIIVDGFPIRLTDTAGLRDTSCEVELEGILRSRTHLEKADLILYVTEACSQLSNEEKERLMLLPKERLIVIRNKIDLGDAGWTCPAEVYQTVSVSLNSEKGRDDVLAVLRQFLLEKLQLNSPPHAVISERHRSLLERAGAHLEEAENLLQHDPEENMVLAAEELREALDSIGKITGQIYTEEMLDHIFGQFCIGK